MRISKQIPAQTYFSIKNAIDFTGKFKNSTATVYTVTCEVSSSIAAGSGHTRETSTHANSEAPHQTQRLQMSQHGL